MKRSTLSQCIEDLLEMIAKVGNVLEMKANEEKSHMIRDRANTTIYSMLEWELGNNRKRSRIRLK